jgi:hypothetical protein
MALSNARRQLEATGSVDVRVAVQVDGNVKWLPIPERIKEGMNSGAFKDAFFGAIREYAQVVNATAVILVSDARRGEPTEKQFQMAKENPQELERLVRTTSPESLRKQGLLTWRECVVVTAQTADEVMVTYHAYNRFQRARRITWGERDSWRSKQDEFKGRQKMFGDLSPENLK